MDAAQAWCRIATAPGLNAANVQAAIAAAGDVQALLQAKPADWAHWGLPQRAFAVLQQPDAALCAAAEEWLAGGKRPGRTLLSCVDAAFPPLLSQIPDAPPVLFVRGDPAPLSSLQLAIVGSRSATPAGLKTAQLFAQALAQAGAVITSGLAEGIDSAAHRGALEAGVPTIAVMGCGPDRIYPARNQGLAKAILESGGALVSEFLPGTPPRREHFPRRNRIISGLSMGVLVVEAALRSGSLITARLAAEQGREVFAIPGSIHNSVARGCHYLIRDGARLVETVDQILEELGPLAVAGAAQSAVPDPENQLAAPDPEHAAVLAAMGTEPLPIDQLCDRTGLAVEKISSILLLLELDGYVSSLKGGRYQRLPD